MRIRTRRSSWPPATATASSPAATTAAWLKPAPMAPARRWAMKTANGSMRWRYAMARPHGLADACSAPARRKVRSKPSTCRRRRAASPSFPRAIVSPPLITTARRCGSPTPARRRRWNGKARILMRRFHRTGVSSSPPCRRIRCMAGGSPTASTCEWPVTPARPAVSHGPQTANGSPPRAPTPASSGPSPARKGRWAKRRANAGCVRKSP